ncbi:MAG: FKBP-type peptidyl-prolyl cis-trans isomerase [Sulfuricaulis sp.]|uniref:FKBP-type peptidyl-prolyl cis-trans isomerase n=1 Tax=Sulfuricaulis sp. TaxID=2003553 RepID=UPI0025E47C27|nr:FKBP-type peptidyl-prolyl cis-trans isomerase [Sulfuricaulis sp.]MCR4347481.1 FKBP-type peptidyl-prolyl cis-trans isomerase [Sulfuricaulis sp.]
MKTGFVFGLLALSLSLNAWGKEPASFKTDKQKFSYTAGYQIGQNLKRQNLDLDSKTFSQGVQDAISDAKPRLKTEEMQAAVQSQQKKDMEKQEVLMNKNLEAGQAFLATNKKKDGVIALPSGLQYKVITEGKGKQPKSTDSVVAHYRGTLINGTEFDSSYKRNEPATFPVAGVIKGWQEALPLMKEGSKWQVFIPADLAYGARGAGAAIGPNEALIFDIELLSVKSNAEGAQAKEDK